MTFMLNNGGAMAISACPDVCQMATPAGPMPTPYPNVADTSMADPGGLISEVLTAFMPTMNIKTKVTLSNGNQAGTLGGVVSGKIMGEMTFTTSSMKVKVGGKPAVYVTCQTTHNGSPPNTMGSVSAPSQTKVRVLG